MEAGSPRLALPMAALLNAVDTVEASNCLTRAPENPKNELKAPEPPLVFLLATEESKTPAPHETVSPPTVDLSAHRGTGAFSSDKAEEHLAEDPAATAMEIDEAPSSSSKGRKAQPTDQEPFEPPAPARRANRRTRQPFTKMQSPSPPPPKRLKTTPTSRTPSVDHTSSASLQSVAAIDGVLAAKPTRAARKRRPTAETPTPVPPQPLTPAAATVPAPKASRVKASAPISLKRNHSAAALADTSLTPSLRVCELCKQVNNICASFYCSTCRRVYHAQCFVESLAPFYDKTQRLELQMDALRLNAPSHPVSMLRCNSCKAAFIEFTRGGFKYDCDCITCTQPEKLLGYRSFTLLEMMREMAEERKQKKKGGGVKAAAKAPAAPGNAAVTADSKKNPRRGVASAGTRQSRRVAAQETVEPEAAAHGLTEAVADGDNAAVYVTEDQDTEPTVLIVMSADDGNGDDEVVEVDKHGVDAARPKKPLHHVETVADSDENVVEPATGEEPEREHEGTPQPIVTKNNPSSHSAKPRKMPVGRGLEAVVSGNCPLVTMKPKRARGRGLEDLVSRIDTRTLYADVRVTVEDTIHSFRVTCTDNPDLRSGGILKEGVYNWHYKSKPQIKCDCCQTIFSQTAHFVTHTSDAFLKKPTTKTASDFLFVQHQWSGKLSPLTPFIQFLRENVSLPSAGGKPKAKSALLKKTAKNVKQSSKKTTNEDELLTKELESEQLNNVDIFRVKRSGQKASDETFGIRVVCMDREGSFNYGGRFGIEHPTAETPVTRARKSGYLLFNTTGKVKYTGVFCDCCGQLLAVEEFVLHTLEDWDRKFKDKYLFVENSNDGLMFYEVAAFWSSLEQLKLKNLLAVYLNKRVKKTIEK